MTEKQFHLSPSPSLISSSAQHSIAKKIESYGRNLFLYLFWKKIQQKIFLSTFQSIVYINLAFAFLF